MPGRCGWLTLWSRFGYDFVWPLVWGGIAYTGGGVMEFMRWPVLVPGVLGPHELFHFWVLAGVGLHWVFMFRIASGEMPPRVRAERRREREPGT